MMTLLPADWEVPDAFGRRLGDAAGRQRAMAADGHLLLVLHEPPVPGVPERTARLFWRDPAGTWKAKPRGEGPQALKRHVEEFAARVDGLEEQWQVARTAQDYYLLLRATAPLHRTARNLLATLQQARELVPEDRDLINLRDQVGEIERAAELLHADARNGLEFTVAHQAEQQAERTYDMAVTAYRLNVLAAMFFPVATLGALFGMNLAHGLEGGSPLYFWGLLVLGLVGGLVLVRVIARKPAPIAKPAVTGKAKRR
jgi:hypothetical protein